MVVDIRITYQHFCLMFKYIIQTMEQIDWMAILPLVAFLLFFTAIVLVWLRKDPKIVKEMANIPLDDGGATIVDQ